MSFFCISDDTDAGPSASDVAVLVVSGELDYTASPHLKAGILDRIRAGRQRLVIDLSAVTFVDSMAIGLLIGTAAQLRETGGSLRVVCAQQNERVLRIFDIAGVAGSIPLDRSRADALTGLLAAPSVGLPSWAGQTTAVASSAGPQPPARQAGLAAAHRYAAGTAAVSDDHHAASHRRRGGEIDRLA